MIGDYTSFTDMIDGGGPGQSGPQFEGGGLLSAVANAVARPVGSRERGEPDMRTGLGGFARDMVDGGGFGQSGPTFQGGLLSGLFNAIGVRPMGYMERLGSVRPQMRPQMSSPAAAAYSAPAAPVEPNYADRLALPPASQPNYADRLALPAAPMASQPDYADRFALPFQRQPVVTPPVYTAPLTDFGDLLIRLQTAGIPEPSVQPHMRRRRPPSYSY